MRDYDDDEVDMWLVVCGSGMTFSDSWSWMGTKLHTTYSLLQNERIWIFMHRATIHHCGETLRARTWCR